MIEGINCCIQPNHERGVPHSLIDRHLFNRS